MKNKKKLALCFSLILIFSASTLFSEHTFSKSNELKRGQLDPARLLLSIEASTFIFNSQTSTKTIIFNSSAPMLILSIEAPTFIFNNQTSTEAIVFHSSAPMTGEKPVYPDKILRQENR